MLSSKLACTDHQEACILLSRVNLVRSLLNCRYMAYARKLSHDEPIQR
jgi:hypothetical protein